MSGKVKKITAGKYSCQNYYPKSRICYLYNRMFLFYNKIVIKYQGEKGMVKTKRFIIYLTTLGIVATSFVGCRNDNALKTKEEKGIATLSWYYPGDKQEDEEVVEAELNKHLEEKLDIHLDLKPIKSTDYTKKISLMHAGKEEFDLLFTSNWTNEYYSCVTRGIARPLNELIDSNAPDLRNILPEFLLDAPRINGEIYAVPNYQVLYKQWSFAIRKDLIDKYKFDVQSIPKEAGFETVKGVEPFLEIIKKNEPDMYPIRQNFMTEETFFEKIEGSSTSIRKGDKSKKVMAFIDAPEWREGIEVSKKWYKNGYIRDDYVNTYSDTSVSGYLKYAVDVMVAKPGMEQELLNRWGKEYIIVPICKPYITASAGMSATTAISTTSKHPEKAIKLIELLNKDKEIYNLLCYGIEGKHYEKTDGKHVRIDSEKKYFPNSAWIFGNQFNAYLLEGQSDETWNLTHELNMTAEKSPIYGFNFNPDPVIDKIVQIKAIQKEYDGLFTYSEEKMDEYVLKLKEAGIDEVVKETQRQIDEWIETEKGEEK